VTKNRLPCGREALIDLANRGDVLLDPFLGSGVTLIAADNVGRVCRGVGRVARSSCCSCPKPL
jgi:DNA modification methylase